MSRNQQSRMDRLERELDTEDTPGVSALEVVMMLADPSSLDPACRARVQAAMDESEAARVRAMEDDPAGKAYRRELDRQGLPQPATLAGIDPVEGYLTLLRSLPPADARA